MTNACLEFNCPECGFAIREYLNVSASRKRGENETVCSSCKADICIEIDIESRISEATHSGNPLDAIRSSDGN